MSKSPASPPRGFRLPRRRRALAALPAGALAALIVLTALIARPGPAGAVTFQEQAARLQSIYAFLLDLRPGAAPPAPTRRGAELSLEIILLPSVDNRVGGKTEPIRAPAAIPRVRARYRFAFGLMAGATLNPALEVDGYTAPWAGVEVGQRLALGPLLGEVRAFAISAEVEGPITDPQTNDRFKVRNHGADFRLGIPWGGWTFYGGAGAGRTESSLLVASDGARIDVERGYTYLLAGAGWSWEPLEITVEQSRTEDFLHHLILAAAWRF